ncbi:efflux transporter, RND family, MFP subunit [Peptoclostridium acidaminophilum DSM 3953]|uniref:Efflux transporter, RND family, MFP subunit n=1 Tax=Peptoclostridium acidaminophilum DSM 3953 TaxID=1286171 RepID=W8U3K4_PEPAC|nr:efflux RND transporter periplasmic adaptor subunit [Peptoclostridium acidaminophilum]AHM55566.1 efflux transporter, RND family, MFP subunit [Peptoclostridium acidaminophilum DSM 3953]
MKNNNSKKWIKRGIIALIAAAVIYASISSYLEPLSVEAYKVQKMSIEDSFGDEGTVVSKGEQDYYSPLAAKVKVMKAKEGMSVKKGDVLLQLDMSDTEYSIRQLEGQLQSIQGQERGELTLNRDLEIKRQTMQVENAQRDYQDAQIKYQKAAALYEQDAMSKQQLDDAKLYMDKLKGVLDDQQVALELIKNRYGDPSATKQYFAGLKKSIQAQIDLLRSNMSKGEIRAESDGVVRTVDAKESKYVQYGEKLLSTIEGSQIEIESMVLTENSVDLREGMNVRVTFEHKPQDFVFDGTVSRIDPSAEETISAIGLVEQRVKTIIQLAGDASVLRPGYKVDLDFIISKSEGAISVPKRAIFKYQDKDSVFVVKSGMAQLRNVTIGAETEDLSIISSGLEEGEIVILDRKATGLEEGKRVKPLLD